MHIIITVLYNEVRLSTLAANRSTSERKTKHERSNTVFPIFSKSLCGGSSMAEPAAGRLPICWRTKSIIYPTNTVCTTLCRLALAISLDAEPARVRSAKPLCSLPRSRCNPKPARTRKRPGSCRSRAWHYRLACLAYTTLRTARLHSRNCSIRSGASFCFTPNYGHYRTCPLYHLARTDDRPLFCCFLCYSSSVNPINCLVKC